MEDTVKPYTPVYHFCDGKLLARFIEQIPRPDLLEYLRSNESLRNRYFRGFHISPTVPSRQQIMAAYKKEIVDRNNGSLATGLCADWVRHESALASIALKQLGIRTDSPADAHSWIADVHSKLAVESYEDILRGLVRKLAPQFSREDIHIFVSVISYSLNQEAVRTLVEEELGNIASDPQVSKERIECELSTARAKVMALEEADSKLKRELEEESKKNQETLVAMQQEDNELATRLIEDDGLIERLTNQLEEIKRELSERKRARDVTEDKKSTLDKAISRQRAEFSKTERVLQRRLGEIQKELVQESNHTAKLNNELQQIEEQLLAIPTSEPAIVSAAPANGINPVTASPSQSPPLGPEQHRYVSELLGNNAVCYQGIQRTFRNAVVAFLRARMARAYPDDHVERLKKTFGEEWNKAAQNASQSRESLGTRTVIRDEYDLLGTNHFYGIFERFYDKIFSSEVGQPPDLPKPVKPRFFGNLKAIKDGRDPLSHPVEEEIPFEEAHHLLYIAQEILKWIGCEPEAAEISKLAGQLSASEAETTSLLRRLPSEDSIYLEFVGRNSLLKELSSCFANPDNKRCLLAGDGGKGKSAAAYRFAQSMPSSARRFQLIIWLSAKKRRFREGIPITVESPDFTTAEEAVDRLLTEYGATAQDMDKPPAERKRLLFEYMNEFPAFIVADDIDTVLEDDEVVSLFTHEIPHTQSCVLVTSRRAIPGIRNFILQGFDPVEAEEFIKSRIRLYGLNTAAFTQTVIREIARVTDSSPLYMDDLMRLTKVVDVHKAINLWTEKGGTKLASMHCSEKSKSSLQMQRKSSLQLR